MVKGCHYCTNYSLLVKKKTKKVQRNSPTHTQAPKFLFCVCFYLKALISYETAVEATLC